ncbi:MAG: AraC family transcriptional regulator [Clostridia bacterium]|nr:AraC family transcriptional regulator [Clostridia bacterium]
MIPVKKFSDGKELFYQHRDMDFVRSTHMPEHHYHPYFEIYYFLHGKCKYFIDGHVYSLLPGDVVLIPAGVIHRTVYSSGYERKLLNFTSDFIPSSAIDTLESILYLYRNPSISQEIKEIFDTIDRDYNTFDRYAEDSLSSLISNLFILLSRNKNIAKEKDGSSHSVAEAIRIISEDFSSDITLFGVAKALSVSPEHLSRAFKRETGFGFNEYLTLIRMQRAERLLSETNKSVSEVAYACGFNDSNYFSAKFKKTNGASPLKFRQYNKKP